MPTGEDADARQRQLANYGDAAVGVGIAGGVALLVTAGTISIRHHARVRHP